jgi:signal transduction histidine kinase
VEKHADAVESARSAALSLRQAESGHDVADLLEDLADRLEAERARAVQFGFDLHDGALQDVVLLGVDMQMLRQQIQLPDGLDDRQRIVGRIDDLIARLTAIHEQLRDIASATESQALLNRPLAATLVEMVASLGSHIHVDTTIDPALDETAFTDAQKLAVLRVVGGGVVNAVRHSGATDVSVKVTQLSDGIEVEVWDDGDGFAVQPTLMRAAQTGKLGLVGMQARARLVGGRLTIDSRPGGPTSIRLLLPSWRRGAER